MTVAILLLAAGHGTRMNSKYQKVLHHVGGLPMVQHLFEAAEAVADEKPVVVVGEGEEGIPRLFGDRAVFVVQHERLGTGHATMVAKDVLAGRSNQLLVTYGDMPLLSQETLLRLAAAQLDSGAALTMLSVMGPPASTFGRVLRDADGRVTEICEVANARQRPNAAEILNTPEQNVGVYCFDANWLWANIAALPLRQARSGREYYLTDMIEMAVRQQRGVEAIVTTDPDECLGAGTREELVAVEQAFRRRTNRRIMSGGVTLVDPATTFIDPGVTVGQDTVIWPNTYLQGQTSIGTDCVIGPNAVLRDATVGHGCTVEQAVLERVELGADVIVPPFTYRSKQ